MIYKIRLISIFYFLMAFFVPLIGIGYLTSEVFEIDDSFLVYVLTIVLFFVCYKLALKLSYGTARITVAKEYIEFKWIKKPLLRFQQNIKLDYTDINGSKFRQEYQYDYFKIYSKGPSIGFERFPEWHPNKDEFYQFKQAFSQRMDRVNKKRKAQSKWKNEDKNQAKPKLIVDKEAQFHKSYWAKVLLLIYIASTVLGIHYIYNNISNPNFSMFIVMFGISGSVFLAVKTFKNLKSKD